MPQYLTPAEAAELLHVSRSWIYQLTADGRIPHIKLGRRVLFEPAVLEAWVAQYRVPQ